MEDGAPRVECAPFARAIAPWVHAFTERGHPGDPFDFGPAGSDTDRARACRRRLCEAIGCSETRLAMPRQVHGARIVEASRGFASPPADAVVTRGNGMVPGIRTADCVPVLIVDPRADVAAAIHAGWRGVASRIVPETMRVLRAHGARPGRTVAAIGPSIGGCCYTVDAEVRSAVEGAVDGRSLRGDGPTGAIDLRLGVRRQLLRAGLPAEGVWSSSECTRCSPGRWFSYRREGSLAGRQVAVVGRA